MAGEDVDLLLLLPPEIWREILIRLPIKSILLCRAVCKSWYSLISCPDFISMYSTRNLDKSGNRVLLNLHDDINGYSFSSHDESFVESIEHDDDDFAEPFRGELRIVGSCNGLICLSKYDRGMSEKDSDITFLIWNPLIRKVFEVPSRTFCPRALCFGFGFDSKACDYKVLCVFVDLGKRPGDSTHVVAGVCEVFDLSKGVWRRISPVLRLWSAIDGPAPDCYLDGVVHWTGYSILDTILSFDMSDEVFGEIMMPKNLITHIGKCNYEDIRSVACGGLIHVIVWTSGPDDMQESCSVWAMKEYGVTDSWTKVSNIYLQRPQGLPNTQLYPPKCLLWENGEVLMVNSLQADNDEEDFVSIQDAVLYNTGSGESKRLLLTDKDISNMCFYKESLVLM